MYVYIFILIEKEKLKRGWRMTRNIASQNRLAILSFSGELDRQKNQWQKSRDWRTMNNQQCRKDKLPLSRFTSSAIKYKTYASFSSANESQIEGD